MWTVMIRWGARGRVCLVSTTSAATAALIIA